MKNKTLLLKICLRIACALLPFTSLADQTWLGTVDNQWTNPANWSGNALPGTNDLVIYNALSTSNLSNYLSRPFSVAGIFVSNPPGPVFINGSPLLVGLPAFAPPYGYVSLDTSKAAQPLTISTPVVITSAQIWTNAGSSPLTVAGPISGTNSLFLGCPANSGRIILTGSNTFTGHFELDGGMTQFGDGIVNGAIPPSVVLSNYSTIDFNVATNTSQTYGGTISGIGHVYKDGAGALYLTGTNTFAGNGTYPNGTYPYSGNITNNAGQLWFNASPSWGLGPKSIVCVTTNSNASIHLNGTNGNVIFQTNVSWFGSQHTGTIFNEAGDNQINGPFHSGSLFASAGGGDAVAIVNAGTLALAGALSGGQLRIGGAGNGTISGTIGLNLLKEDSGTWTIPSSSFSTCYGYILVEGTNAAPGGTLVVNGFLQFPTASLQVYSNSTLSGYGVVEGPTTIQPGGTLALGTGLGTFSVQNTLSLRGTNVMKVARAPGFTATDLIAGVTTLSFGGTLIVLPLGSGWAAGDAFKLYEAVSYTNSFGNISFPPLSPGLAWDTSALYTSGTLKIISVPYFNNIVRLSNAQMRFTYSYPDSSGTAYRLWTSSDPTLKPITTAWTLLTNGTFSGTPITFTDHDAPNHPDRFYIISVP
ncbi:MAG: hypothetical protein C5B50_07895 [Verrucomicrobia bacterium]|nr:MAG: hypothetical protein C5B50_07895 [Verrucomicrobiota bacterium]